MPNPHQPNTPLIEISDPEQDRYARLRLMAGYRQETIQKARIMVVGAGALGNEVLKNLALLGVGHLFVVDFDTIEVSNLTRSVLFRAQDAEHGRPKAEVVAERLRDINPDVDVIAVKGDVAHDIGLGTFRAMDLVIGCLDNRDARLAVNRACWRTGRPWIDGALHGGDGSVRVFVPPAGTCYECLMTKQDYTWLNLRYNCPPGTVRDGVAITTPMSASIIGAMQVQEAVKLLHGLPVQGGQGVTYSAETLRTTRVEFPRRPDCPAHQTYDDIISLPWCAETTTLRQLLAAAGDRFGDRAVLTLPDKVATYLYCSQCDAVEKIYRPLRHLTPDVARCPACRQERVYDIVGALAGGADSGDIPLSQLGIPPLDIVEIRAGHARAYVELSGDAEAVLVGW
jgi:molybdopterin/thiamine biosynthesis adenylyltransferase